MQIIQGPMGVVSCYGDLDEDSNFEVVCEYEQDDDTWAVGNPAGGSFDDWEQVVNTLQGYFGSAIQEITAC